MRAGIKETGPVMTASPTAPDVRTREIPTRDDAQRALLDALAGIVGANQLLVDAGDTARYEADWRRAYPGRALAVVRPASTAAVARVVSACARAGTSIVPQGGNTGLVGGSTPDESGGEVVLSLERLRAVRRVDPLDNAMTIEAGCTVLAAQQAAADVDRLFPLSLASEGSATIGGVISTNAGGEQVLRYGNTRDLVLGLEVVLADGRVLDGLGALRKDNTGYDLKQLFIGGEGTLGIVTAATMRLYARPRQVVTAFVAVRDPQAAVELLARLTDALGERVTAFELMARGPLQLVLRHAAPGMRSPLPEVPAWSVLLDVSEVSRRLDPRPVVEDVLADAAQAGLVLDAALAASDAQAHAFWALRDHVPEAQRLEGASIKHDISVPVSCIPAFIAQATPALERAVPGIRVMCFGHVGDGNLHFNQSRPDGMGDAEFHACTPAVHALVYEIAASFGGSISAEHGIGRQKQSALLRFKSPVAIDLMSRIRQAIDPAATFNPGRVLPRAETPR